MDLMINDWVLGYSQLFIIKHVYQARVPVTECAGWLVLDASFASFAPNSTPCAFPNSLHPHFYLVLSSLIWSPTLIIIFLLFLSFYLLSPSSLSRCFSSRLFTFSFKYISRTSFYICNFFFLLLIFISPPYSPTIHKLRIFHFISSFTSCSSLTTTR